MIWLSDLSKSYGTGSERRTLFEAVDLLIPSGIVVGVIGKRASGKSTLLKLVAGAELPDRGNVFLEGGFLWSGGMAATQHSEMTVIQNLRFLCRLYTTDDREMEEGIRRILDLADLTDYRHTLWRDVPSTHKPLLSYAALAVLRTDWLLLDGLISRNKSPRILEELGRKMEETSTLLAVNSLRQIRKYCDAVIVIRHKRLHYFEQIKEAIQFYKSEPES